MLQSPLTITETPSTNSVSASVLNVLLYYDIFNYPLTAEEIKRHCRQPGCTSQVIQNELAKFCNEGKVFCIDGFYLLSNDPALVLRRINGNRNAKSVHEKAMARSQFIAKFPFVRCVCISGSLSKDYFDETTDIDFFIITQPNRLWLCRSLMILYKKIFLFNSKKYFCVNYFIDEDNLIIPDHNLFTATEIVTLLPMYNQEVYQRFFDSNGWVKSFYPNSSERVNGALPEEKAGFKKFSESILNGKFGEWLDQYFFRLTLKYWKKKFSEFSAEEFDLNLRSRKNVSKHHPRGFQSRVLTLYEEKCRAFELKHNISLS